MTTPEPNPKQRKLIEQTDGLYLVNAGAGTGKTFTLTRRYANIVSQPDVSPSDILLVTFTRNAATEMADRIAQEAAYDPVELQDAPISTFHAYCYRLLRRYGYATPAALGIDEELTDSLTLIEDEIRETKLFREFFTSFADSHPEYESLLAALDSPTALRSLIEQLATKGVIPQQQGWYRDTGELLEGDREVFCELLEQHNRPGEGAYGPTQSDARSSLSGWDETDFEPSAPSPETLFEGKVINEDAALEAFDADRSKVFDFIQDVYVEYLTYALQRNYLTQSLMLTMAFVMLCENEAIRHELSHDYVMVDEFQDTNPLQFKLSLLLAADDNICVVGDWKQSIYGFQHTEIENITAFPERIKQYKAELNADRERITYAVDDIETIPLIENYRSTDSILSLATETLTTPATRSEELDKLAITADLTPLEATNYIDNSQIKAYTHADECELILDRIEYIVGNPEYSIEIAEEETETADDTDPEAAEQQRLAPPRYDDIAIFTRTRAFARELLEAADGTGIPIAYEGGVELFDTDQAKVLLAWLRIVDSGSDRGWATVLEAAGYPVGQATDILETDSYPASMEQFADQLTQTETIGGFARLVFDTYGYDGAYADGLIAELTGRYESTLVTRSEAISYIVQNLEAGTTVDIDSNPGGDAVTLQTIHSSKGLEYPIVILGNMNYRSFPHFGKPSASSIQYDSTLGLRQTKRFTTATGQPYVFDEWTTSVLSGVVPSTYDEERRLFYVAVTRAKRHFVCTASENPSQFFEEIPIETESLTPAIESRSPSKAETAAFSMSMPTQTGPIRLSVHALMDESVYEEIEGGRGMEFGDQVHQFAETYAKGDPATATTEDERNVQRLIDTIDGEFKPEITAILPLAGEPTYTLVGIIDLVVITPATVRIIDYKTDRTRQAESQYRKQLSVYYHVIKSEYPTKSVTAEIFYTATDEVIEIDPLSTQTLREAADSIA